MDWYGKGFAQDKVSIGSLEPSESVSVTFFSMVNNDEQIVNGVIKADKFTCRVDFR